MGINVKSWCLALAAACLLVAIPSAHAQGPVVPPDRDPGAGRRDDRPGPMDPRNPPMPGGGLGGGLGGALNGGLGGALNGGLGGALNGRLGGLGPGLVGRLGKEFGAGLGRGLNADVRGELGGALNAGLQGNLAGAGGGGLGGLGGVGLSGLGFYGSPGMFPGGYGNFTSAGGYGSSPGYGGYGYGGGYPYSSYYNPYMSYYPDPNSGFLYGTAGVINASGQYAVQLRQASLIGQQVEQARVDTRRKILDQWLYERAVLPTNQDERERVAKLELRRAMNNAPTSEILAATTLNRLYQDAKEKLTKGVKGQPIPVDESILKQINVTTSAGNGNVGVLKPLKDGGSLNWPPILLGEGYGDEVKKVNTRAAELVKEVEFKGAVDPGRLQDFSDALARLQAKVNANVGDLTPSQWIDAKRFLGQLEEARKALGKADVANYFTNKFTAKGKTVPELIQNMAEKGLEFAPSTNGDEAAYVSLYNSLLAYLNSVSGRGE